MTATSEPGASSMSTLCAIVTVSIILKTKHMPSSSSHQPGMQYNYQATPSSIPTGIVGLFSGLTISLLIVLGIVLLMFFIGRVVVLWYLKINKMVSLLEQIANNTGKGDQVKQVVQEKEEKKDEEVIKEIKIF